MFKEFVLPPGPGRSTLDAGAGEIFPGPEGKPHVARPPEKFPSRAGPGGRGPAAGPRPGGLWSRRLGRLMGRRSARTTGWIRGWICLVALALWLISGAAQAVSPGTGPARPGQARPHVVSAPGLRTGRLKQPKGPTSAPGSVLAQASETESGGEGHSGAALQPGWPAPAPDPGCPGGIERPGEGRSRFLASCAAGGTGPRPPPAPPSRMDRFLA